MYPPGTRVRFASSRGPLLGTVLAIFEDDVHTVWPDDRTLDVMLLQERCLVPVPEEAGVPPVAFAEPL